ncbi:hypothetical protein [Burkholderia cepacia]|uniref:hypothetical protein n=1 Tax=Burkholderia cepacia TaxID=292 RepID=UPI000F58094A|nr:hypothetical protein [Burkholderia cepacia]
MRARRRFAANSAIEGRAIAQTGQIVKQFQEIRCSWKSLSSKGLRNILHVVSRNIDKIARLNGGAWSFRALHPVARIKMRRFVSVDTYYVVFEIYVAPPGI